MITVLSLTLKARVAGLDPLSNLSPFLSLLIAPCFSAIPCVIKMPSSIPLDDLAVEQLPESNQRLPEARPEDTAADVASQKMTQARC